MPRAQKMVLKSMKIGLPLFPASAPFRARPPRSKSKKASASRANAIVNAG